MYIIAAILIFGVLIAVHELGHFLAAKACGVRVNEFSIGMGPAIFHTTKGETEYSLRLLPIGGFCAMEGEDVTQILSGEESWEENDMRNPESLKNCDVIIVDFAVSSGKTMSRWANFVKSKGANHVIGLASHGGGREKA